MGRLENYFGKEEKDTAALFLNPVGLFETMCMYNFYNFIFNSHNSELKKKITACVYIYSHIYYTHMYYNLWILFILG